MDLKFDIQDLLLGKEALGVEATFQDGNLVFTTTKLIKLGNNIKIDDSKHYPNKQELLESIDVEIPVYLSVGGKGVINKTVKAPEDIQYIDLLQKVLPNAGIDDFIVQRKRLTQQQFTVSVIRKAVLDELLNDLQQRGTYVLKVVVGPFALENIGELISSENSTIDVTGHQLQFQNGQLIGYQATGQKASGSLLIGDDNIDVNQLIAFTSGLYHFTQPGEAGGISMEDRKDEFKNKKIFKFGGFGVLGFFLLCLMVNFFVFDSYRSDFQQLSSRVNLDKGKLTELAILEDQLNQKKGFLGISGVLESSKTSYYSDQLAMSIPKSMKLTGMHIHPIIGKIEKEEAIRFDGKLIKLKGNSKKSTDFNAWVKEIEEYQWVNNLKILNYSQTGGASTGEFELEIQVD